MTLAPKMARIPTPEQEPCFRKAYGVARFTYNGTLARWNELRATGEQSDALCLNKEWDAIQGEQFSWMYEVTKCAPQAAFANDFRVLRRLGVRRTKHATFPKRHGCRDGFYVSNDEFVVEGKQIRPPQIGFAPMREHLRFQGKILGATVSHQADWWFVAVRVQVEEEPAQRQNQSPVGMDLGILHAGTRSTGKFCDAPRSLAKNLQKLRRLSLHLSRTHLGSRNREKTRKRLARLHRRTNLPHRYGVIVPNDRAVASLVQNQHLTRAMADVGFGELRRQLRYRAALRGGQVALVGRLFPLSKLCRPCESKNDALTWANRTFICPAFGHTEDRDLHASRNILREGLKTAAGPWGSIVHGRMGSTKRHRFASRLAEAERA